MCGGGGGGAAAAAAAEQAAQRKQSHCSSRVKVGPSLGSHELLPDSRESC